MELWYYLTIISWSKNHLSKQVVLITHRLEKILLQILHLNVYEFEKWRAIPASVGGVGGVLTWVAC